jgi:small subunit ribosomal protein S3
LGQKVHPIGFRLGYTKSWSSKWYAEREYQALLHEDIKIRRLVKDKLIHAGVSKIEIERSAQTAKVNIYTARPGIIIGRKGAEVEKLKKDLEAFTGKQIYINIMEVKKPEIEAQLVAENIALQLVKRIAFRRAMKKSVAAALRFGAQGIRLNARAVLPGQRLQDPNGIRRGECLCIP